MNKFLKLLSILLLLSGSALAQPVPKTVQPAPQRGSFLIDLPLNNTGALIDEDANTVSHVYFNTSNSNYALQSNTMSSGTSANSPWSTMNSSTVTTIAGVPAAQGGGTWANVTDNTGTGYYIHDPTFPFTTSSFTTSIWAAKQSGTGSFAMTTGCSGPVANTPTSCSCSRSDGGACASAITSAYYCNTTITDVGTTPIRVSTTQTCTTPINNSRQHFVPGGGVGSSIMLTGAQFEPAVTSPTPLVVTTTAPMTTRPINTNYVKQSNTMSTSTSATSPWTLSGTNVSTVAGVPAAQGGGTWAELTSTSTFWSMTQNVTTPSTTSAVGSMWISSPAGAIESRLQVGCNNGAAAVATCSCVRSDGGACTAVIAATNYCRATATDIATAPVRLSAITTCSAATTSFTLQFSNPLSGVSTRLSGSQLEINTTTPSTAIPTLASAVSVDRSLVDTKGNIWAMAGTVPQNQSDRSSFIPGKAGSGPYSAANYYALGSGNDVLDFPGGEFTMCFVHSGGTSGTTGLFGNGAYSASGSGWNVNTWTGDRMFFATNGPIGRAFQVTVNSIPYYALTNISCFGRAGTTIYGKVNALPTASVAAASYTPGTSVVAKLGFDSAGFAGNLQEFYATTTPWNEANVVAIQNKVLGHYALSGNPISVTRALNNATYIPRAADCIQGKTCLFTAPAGVARITENGLLVEPTRTNYAFQSNTMSTGTAATSPWALTGTATVATVAGAPMGGTWAEVTNTTNTNGIYQQLNTASTTTLVGSVWAAKASGSGTISVWGRCQAGVNATSCACNRSDGGICTTSLTTPEYCNTINPDIGTTPVRISVTYVCASPVTSGGQLFFIPGEYGVSTGTTRFSGAQLEVGTYPTSLIVTTTAAATRNADQVTTTVPAFALQPLKSKWCLGVTARGINDRGPGGSEAILSFGSPATANSMYLSGYYFEIWDGTANAKWNGSSVPGTSSRIVACNDAYGQLFKYVDGVKQPIAYGGTGAGVFSIAPTTLGVGSGWGTYLGGYLKDLKLCMGSDPRRCN